MQKILELFEVENGWVLKTVYPEVVGASDSCFVFVDDETRETLTPILEAIADKLGFGYDKFIHDNLSITWDKKGHKAE